MIRKIISVSVCTICFLYTVYVLRDLTHFLSNHRNEETLIVADENEISPVIWSLLVDMSLLSIFMIQHTVMASTSIKNIFCKLSIEHMTRTVYNMSSAAVLHLLLSHWQLISWIKLWEVDTFSNSTSWFTFTAFHVLAWFIIYSGCLMMDISELTGLKQVYYKLSGRPNPMEMKSLQLLRYYSHMRHPSFIGFLIILWIHPFMTLDRLLLASILSLYMVLMWKIDEEDYNYHVCIVRRKQRELY